jgi:hypothetical protein
VAFNTCASPQGLKVLAPRLSKPEHTTRAGRPSQRAQQCVLKSSRLYYFARALINWYRIRPSADPSRHHGRIRPPSVPAREIQPRKCSLACLRRTFSHARKVGTPPEVVKPGNDPLDDCETVDTI